MFSFKNVNLSRYNEVEQKFNVIYKDLNLTIDFSTTPSVILLSISSTVTSADTINLELYIDQLNICKIGPTQILFQSDSSSSNTIQIGEYCNLSCFLIHFANEDDVAKLYFYINEIKLKLRSKSLPSEVVENGENIFDHRTETWSATQYFQFYSYLSQQQNMMQDLIRTATYQKAILSNAADFKDKVVLDVGAGSGILSFFAVQAGAKRVYAVEASNMAGFCSTLVQHNKLAGRIIVVSGKIEEVTIPEPVDILISEPMGYMLYNERMLETYLHAKKFLRSDGERPAMFPTVANLYVAPFTDEALYMETASKANFWYQQSFHGVELCSVREAANRENFSQPIVDTFDIAICMATPISHKVDFRDVHESDLYTVDIPLKFKIQFTGSCHGLATWFDVGFLGSQKPVWLSTAPMEPLTHWYQVRCLFQTPLFVFQGQEVTGRLVMVANKRQSYDLDIELRLPDSNVVVRNSLDLKNPCFRYTGQPVAPPPGSNSKPPTETYFASSNNSVELDNSNHQSQSNHYQPQQTQYNVQNQNSNQHHNHTSSYSIYSPNKTHHNNHQSHQMIWSSSASEIAFGAGDSTNNGIILASIPPPPTSPNSNAVTVNNPFSQHK